MSKLSGKERGALPKSEFALPGERKYPVPDKSHAANAKARASQQEAKGNISKSTEAKIDAKANKVLHGGSRSAGHANVVNAHSHAGKLKHS
jgi:hypothetical protein